MLFGTLIQTGKASKLFIGSAIGGVLMALGGIMELVFGIDAEQQPLEEVAPPLHEVDGGSEPSG